MADLVDRLGRPLGSIRLSVTDRCNMRCRYCMPEDNYAWLPKSSILSFEEIDRLAGVLGTLGAHKFRLTGGEPLLRHDLAALVAMLSRRSTTSDLALTTNGLLLGRQAAGLKAAGLDRLTVSLDTLRPERMLAFARTAGHHEVLAGIEAAAQAGFTGIKINSVIIRGYNDDEVLALLEFARARQLELRFIEYMDVGGATDWSADKVVSRRELLQLIGAGYGTPLELSQTSDPRAPADRFQLPDGTVFGIIASTTAPFCRDCDRARLTADGTFFLCLYARTGIDLRQPLRSGASDDDLARLIGSVWSERTDRGAEDRLRVENRGALYQLESLRADPHREMHTR
ncbi:MAG: GTP 3',8-cyclase MoaA, partial [Gemmatimonadota bacterium]